MADLIRVSMDDYCAAQPFPHCVIDEFYDPAELQQVLREWPAQRKMLFKACGTSVKAHNSQWGDFGATTVRVLQRLNSSEFIKELERLTGLDGLFADPTLAGGGLHEIPHGGFLNMHVDFNWHARLSAARKLNLLLYLNDGWVWNGELLLSSDGVRVDKTVAPLFNRCVIFTTSERSWHGHPDPLTSPNPRRSIALYYYRREAMPERVHSTIYAGAA